MTGQMRTGPAARDPSFRGIDPPALDHLIKQMRDADAAIKSWLNGHRPPPGVPATGYRQAEQVAQWASGQLGMLTRRYSYAMTDPGGGDGVQAPPAPVPPSRTPDGGAPDPGQAPGPVPVPPRPQPVRPVSPVTPRGAGDDLGDFATRQEAAKAARTDAAAVAAAVQDRRPVPESVWAHLKANAGDPDYTEKLYERLGPAAAADLIKAADGDPAKLAVAGRSLGTASHHLTMDARWLRAFLAQADHAGIRPVAVGVLTGARLSERTREAMGRVGIEVEAG